MYIYIYVLKYIFYTFHLHICVYIKYIELTTNKQTKNCLEIYWFIKSTFFC